MNKVPLTPRAVGQISEPIESKLAKMELELASIRAEFKKLKDTVLNIEGLMFSRPAR